MSYYFVANIKIEDQEVYRRYLEGADEVFSRFKGEYLAVDPDPGILEGSWAYGRAVIIRFPTKEDFEAWYRSDEYQDILTHRLTAARCDTILVKGKE